jgi:hypothetical protein
MQKRAHLHLPYAFFPENRKALSDVITTLIIVLLSLVAIGIVWVVISNIIKSGEQQTSFQFGTLFLDLQLEKVTVNADDSVSVTVKRGVGEGELAGVAFVFSDGEKSITLKKTVVLSELGSQSFSFTQAELEGISFVKQVEIAPILSSDNKEQVGRIVDLLEKNKLGLDDLKKDYGIVSWWRLNGNANDEIRGNQGNILGNTNCNAEGKFGKGCEFFQTASVQDYIEFSQPVQIEQPWTACTWVYRKDSLNQPRVFLDDSVLPSASNYYSLRFAMSLGNGAAGFTHYTVEDYWFSSEIPRNKWNFICFAGESNIVKLYIDGQFREDHAGVITPANLKLPVKYLGHSPLRGTDTHATIGIIDEVMVFNKALNSNQVQELYDFG